MRKMMCWRYLELGDQSQVGSISCTGEFLEDIHPHIAGWSHFEGYYKRHSPQAPPQSSLEHSRSGRWRGCC